MKMLYSQQEVCHRKRNRKWWKLRHTITINYESIFYTRLSSRCNCSLWPSWQMSDNNHNHPICLSSWLKVSRFHWLNNDCLEILLSFWQACFISVPFSEMPSSCSSNVHILPATFCLRQHWIIDNTMPCLETTVQSLSCSPRHSVTLRFIGLTSKSTRRYTTVTR